MPQKINITGISLYGYHGCLDAEAKIGQQYKIDIEMTVDFSEAAETDDLTKTIDYCDVYELVKTEMAIRSRLIEQVGLRIKKQLHNRFPQLIASSVKVTKFNPPMNGNVAEVSIEL